MAINDKWLSSMKTLLGSVDHNHIQSYSISIVPEGLKESNRDGAYMPRVVSMGPRFKESREDLLLMEEVKLRCMLSVIHRAGIEGQAGAYVDKCSVAIWNIDAQIRASYVADLNDINKEDLAKIMFVDGCFLLELLIFKGFSIKELPELPCRLTTPSPAPQVLKNEDVLSDLLLFENQIPICVLHALSRTLFPHLFEEKLSDEERAIKINNLALSLLGYSHGQCQTTYEAPHILDVVHDFVNKKGESESKNDEDDGNNHVVEIPGTQIKLNRCASRLRAAGVTIKVVKETNSKLSHFSFLPNCFRKTTTTSQVDVPPKKAESEIKGLDFEFKFDLEKGKLEIVQLHIKETTKATWRNIIAWEHHQNKGKSSSPNGKFTSAALIFDGLICCAADVKLLKDKNIIVDDLKRSNEELEAFFHRMSFGVDDEVVDSSYVKLVGDLNDYSKAFFMMRMWRLFLHVLRCALQRLLKFMTKNYHLLLSFAAFLTFVQTFYAMLAYHRPT